MLTIACVNVGDKYSKDYVNFLFRQVNEKMTIPRTFVCYTNQSGGYDAGITTIFNDTIPPLTGLWNKMALFSPGLLSGPVLYFDLDVIIQNNCDSLMSCYDPHRLKLVSTKRPESRVQYNSSVMLFNPDNVQQIWKRFISNPAGIQETHKKMDSFLWYKCNQSISVLPKQHFYSRLYGIDGTVKKYHHEPKRMICILDDLGTDKDAWKLTDTSPTPMDGVTATPYKSTALPKQEAVSKKEAGPFKYYHKPIIVG